MHTDLLHTDTHTHTRTRAHAHARFCEKWGHPIGIMFFILYKLYVILPYTNPTPKLGTHRSLCQRKQRIALYIILGHYSNMVLRHVPTNKYYIYIYAYSIYTVIYIYIYIYTVEIKSLHTPCSICKMLIILPFYKNDPVQKFTYD